MSDPPRFHEFKVGDWEFTFRGGALLVADVRPVCLIRLSELAHVNLVYRRAGYRDPPVYNAVIRFFYKGETISWDGPASLSLELTKPEPGTLNELLACIADAMT